MNDTITTRDALISGIERLASSVESLPVLRRVWKILDRECTAQGGIIHPAMSDRDALRYYARHLKPHELKSTLDHIRTITKM